MNHTMGWKAWAKLALLAVGVAASVFLAVPSAKGVDATTCPVGWSERSDLEIAPTITMFCVKWIGDNGGQVGDVAHFIKVPSQHVAQHIETDTVQCGGSIGSEVDPNPVLLKRPTYQWMGHLRETCGQDIAVVINGTFFKQTTGIGSALAYPIHSLSTYEVTGDDINPVEDRRCLAFGGLNNDVAGKFWTLGNTDWDPTHTAMVSCKGLMAHGAVGISPVYPIPCSQGIFCQRNLIGVDRNDAKTACFLIGGYYEDVVDAYSQLLGLGCTPLIQFDGGASVGISVFDYEYELIYSEWAGPFPRHVPHAITIWGS